MGILTRVRHADQFAAAADHFARLVAELPTGRLEDPGLGAWNLRALVGHTARAVLTVEAYLDRPAQEVEVQSAADYYLAAAAVDPAGVAERGRQAGRELGPDHAEFVRAAVHRVVPRVCDQPPDFVLHTVLGGMRLSDYLATRVFELVTHCLDISQAADIDLDPPEATLHEALRLATQIAVRRGDGPTILRALTGRQGLPGGFSIV